MYLSAVCVIILININAIVGGTDHYKRSPEKHAALFVFGDSLFDPGNNNYFNTSMRANFWPYGETFFGFPTGRFSDGRVIPDFISEYAKLPLIPPYLKPGVDNYAHGVNFASAGAGALVETHQGLVVDLKTQLKYFKKVEKQLRHKLGDREAEELITSSVYLFSVGSNDYHSSLKMNYSKKEYVGMVLGNITQVIQGIYKIGGRKFGFVTLPPMDCFPPRNTGSCLEEENSAAKPHNRALSKALQLMQSQLKGFIYSKHDLYTSFSERMENPSKYGFKEANRGCFRMEKEFELCDNPSDYFFFDSVHPTEKANKQLAKLIWSGNSDITEPYNLKALFEVWKKIM